MAWPATFAHPTREALVLVPSDRAIPQDLGEYRTGRNLETDILPKSALLCASQDGSMIVDDDGLVHFAFEGNANGAVNLERFHERCQCAAGRLATRAPSSAYGHAQAEDLTPVASFDLLNYVFVEVIDAAAMELWAGEPVSSFLPPPGLNTPSDDASITAPLTQLPMRSLANGHAGIFLWMLMDGTILSKEGPSPLVAWRPGDDGLPELLERAGLEMSKRMLLAPNREGSAVEE